MLFECCVKSLNKGDWFEVEADTAEEAAEEHVRDLCLCDSDLYGVFASDGEVVTVCHGDAEINMRVIVDLEPVFWTELEK